MAAASLRNEVTSATEAPSALVADADARPTPRERLRALPSAVWRREHLLFGVLFLAGVVLRWITWRAYRPALLFPDSHTYLREAEHLRFGFWQPSGYPAFLWPLLRLHHPTVIPLVQHLLGLTVTVLLYLVLRRRGVPSWGAALAAAPLLLDPLQLDIEQFVLSDVLFEFLVCVALVLFAWRRRPGVLALGVAGLCLGGATLTRNAGMLLVAIGIVVAIALHLRVRAVAAFLATFVLTVGAYVVGHHAVVGTYAITDTGSRYLYARLASSIVDCPTLTLPLYERQLCPPEPLHHRKSPDHYMWGYRTSPQYQAKPPPGMTQLAMVKDFDHRVIKQQPFAYARVAAYDFLRGFQWHRTVGPNDIRFSPFQFQPHYPTRWIRGPLPDMKRILGIQHVSSSPGEARFLVSYQRWFHVPGPFMAACLALAALAVLGVGRAKRSGLRTMAFLFGGGAVLVLVPAALAVGFSWRYQLQQLLFLPPAGALALTALIRPVPAETDESSGDLAVERVTTWLLRLPMPARVRAMAERGHAERLVRYSLGSVICTAVSAAAFVVFFSTGALGSRSASLAASGIAAIVGYYLNRRWTWGQKHRANWRTELLPYWVTIIVSAVLAALVTGAVNSALRSSGASRGIRTAVDLLAYLGTYGVAFVGKYLLFHRLFTTPTVTDSSSDDPAVARASTE